MMPYLRPRCKFYRRPKHGGYRALLVRRGCRRRCRCTTRVFTGTITNVCLRVSINILTETVALRPYFGTIKLDRFPNFKILSLKTKNLCTYQQLSAATMFVALNSSLLSHLTASERGTANTQDKKGSHPGEKTVERFEMKAWCVTGRTTKSSLQSELKKLLLVTES